MPILRHYRLNLLVLLPVGYILFFPQLLWSQSNNFRNFRVEDGLPGNEVYDVLQDDEGYMWFSTDRGVSRYNGYEFQNYTIADGLTDNTVFSMYKDEEGRVWFLSYSPELCYFENDRFTKFRYNHLIRRLNLGKIVTWRMEVYNDTVFVEADKGVLYWVTDKGDIACYQAHYGGFANEEAKWITSVKLSEHHGKWSVKKYIDKRSGPEILEYLKTPEYKDYLSEIIYPYKINDQLARYILGEDTIWYRDKELRQYSGHRLKMKSQLKNELLFLYRDKKGWYWFSYVDGGIDLLNNPWNHQTPLKHYFEHQGISAMEEDHEGGKWFTSLHNGVFYSPPDYDYIIDLPAVMPSAPVMQLTGNTRGEVFISYNNGEVWKLDDQLVPNATRLQEEQINYFEYYPLYYDTVHQQLFHVTGILPIYKGSREEILRKLNKQREDDLRRKGEVLAIPEFISIISDQRDGFYTSTNRGYLHFPWDKPVDQVVRFIHKKNNSLDTIWYPRIDAMYVHRGTPVYLALPEGLYSMKEDTISFLGRKFPLLKGRFDVIEKGTQNEFFLGNRSQGLVVWSEDTIYRVDEKSGLPGNQVKAIEVINEKEIWVGTDQGLCRMTKTEDGKWKFRIFSSGHGLPSIRVNTLLYHGNYLYVGTDGGLCKIRIDKLTENDIHPRLYLAEIKVNGSSVPMIQPARLASDENQIYFSYIGLTYKNRQDIEYRYRLEGLEDKWQTTTNREARYDFLPPGEYTFLLSTVNENGITGNMVSWSFLILKPFWLRWWFFVIEGVVVLLLFILIIKIRERNLRKSLRVKQRIIELELKALRSQMNPHFTFNTLASIQQYIMQNEASVASNYIAEFASLIRKVLENSKKDLVPLDEELDTVRMYLDLECMRFDNRLGYEIVIPEGFNTELFLIPSMIIQPYLENAILHGILPSTGQGLISIVIEELQEAIKITITDNGIGRGRSMELKKDRIVHNKSDSLGMQITAERLDLISEAQRSSYRVKVSDVINDQGEVSGTRVEIYFSFANNDEPYTEQIDSLL